MDRKELFESVDDMAQGLFGDRSWPDAAFVVEKGAEKDEKGRTLQKYRHLPHHSKSVKKATEHGTVDLPHLRNALARVNQVKPVKEGAAAYRKRAQSHLSRHANKLLKTRQEKVKESHHNKKKKKKAKSELQEIIDLMSEFGIREEDC
jgi:hypothetical protein